jgi:hypothetical protein
MSVYAFGPFILDVAERRLTRDGGRMSLVGKPMEILIGEPAPALAALERCVAERNDHVPFLLQYPSFHPLRGEPRYERLVRDLEDGIRRPAALYVVRR